jgi:hypothetical protein
MGAIGGIPQYAALAASGENISTASIIILFINHSFINTYKKTSSIIPATST